MGLLQDSINSLYDDAIERSLSDGQSYKRKPATPSLIGAMFEPQFKQDVSDNLLSAVGLPPESALGGRLPSADTLSSMDWASLRNLRDRFASQQDQNVLAPFEHQAYAREFTNSIPDAVKNAIFSFGYTPYKAITGDGRSKPSLKAIGRGLLGTWEGMTK